MDAPELVTRMLRSRLPEEAGVRFEEARAELAAGADAGRLAQRLSAASRTARDREPLAPTEDERRAAGQHLAGWNPERWTLLETLRVALLLAHPGFAGEGAQALMEELFRYADEGEQRALYRSLALLPRPEAFRWRAAEGCRTNMVSVFEANVLDTPYPLRWFDDVAWRQAVLKCVFVGAPLWRLYGLDERLSEELARMALDLVDERRSAHREVQPELWACVGPYGGERALASIERELAAGNPHVAGRRAGALALARHGARERLAALHEAERDAAVRATMERALEATPSSTDFGVLRSPA